MKNIVIVQVKANYRLLQGIRRKYTGCFNKNYLLKQAKVFSEFFYIMKFKDNILIFLENYAQPFYFAYNYFPQL